MCFDLLSATFRKHLQTASGDNLYNIVYNSKRSDWIRFQTEIKYLAVPHDKIKVTVNKIGCPAGKSSYARYFYWNHRKLYITVKLMEHKFWK